MSRGRAATAPAVALLLTVVAAEAGERRFAYSYETLTHPPGSLEVEQWVTWKTDPDFDRLDFRHEIELGVTESFALGIYLTDWRYQRSEGGHWKADWRNVAVEGVLTVTDPTTRLVGSAVYGEVKVGDELFVLETKLLLQRMAGPWVLAWNGTVEAEWEGPDHLERKGELAQTFGATFELSPRLFAGAELLHEIEIDDWSDAEDHVVYAGPSVCHRADGWFAIVAPLFQITDVAGEAGVQSRLLVGIDL